MSVACKSLRTAAGSYGRIGQPDTHSLGFVDEAAKFCGENPINAMSVDVEDYFQVSAFENHVSRGDWDSLPSRLPRNIERILQLFDDADCKATFFTLGWVAAKLPKLVADIAAQGHEIASHGFGHSRVWTQTPKQFLEDVSRARNILEDVSGKSVIGYRAPSFSVSGESLWAHEVLHEAGYRYSSSVYPISHDHYGFPAAPRFPFRFVENGLLEIPLTSISMGNKNWPCAGGGYFRLLPLTYSRWALKRVNSVDRMPTVFYFHPWELDPDQPRVPGIPVKARFRHYVNLARFEKRLACILREFRWGRLDSIYRDAL